MLIVRVVLRNAMFLTDRGSMRLPAWSFYFHGVRNPAAVLALARRGVFDPPQARTFAQGVSPFEDDSATIANDDRTITIAFVGAPGGVGQV